MRSKKHNPSPPDDLITPEEAAELLNVTPAVLQMRRHQNRPPRWYKLGPGLASHVRYSRQDVLDYLGSCLHDPQAPARKTRGGRR